VSRGINTLCSRLLLYGFLEGLHALDGDAVEKVGSDMNRELAVVRVEHQVGSTESGEEPLSTEIAERLSTLERSIDKHQRVIKRAITIATRYFQDQQT